MTTQTLPRIPTEYFSPSEQNFWNGVDRNGNNRKSDDATNESYKNNERRILTEMNREKLPIFVEALKRSNYMDLRPSYQRRARWSKKQKSLLIESFIINIPIPPIILYEKEYSSYEVIDGQQRINAIKEFYNNEFGLQGLELWSELNGKKYNQLPDGVRAGIDRRSLSSIVVITESAKDSEEEMFLKQLAFERLNTGGIDLSKQEVRNCLYAGKFNDLLHKLSRNSIFTKAWGIPENEEKLVNNTLYKKMEDIELILRFFSLRHIDKFTGRIEQFLTHYMIKSLQFGKEDIDFLSTIFLETIGLAHAIYGQYLFKPFDIETKEWKQKSYKAFYDDVMVGFSNFLDKKDMLLEKKPELITQTKKLFESDNAKLLMGRGKSKADLQNRIKVFNDMLLSCCQI
ncbi:MAG: DUF262 domain-containing protein [Cyanobacteria bacterium P01_E01_bin.42]